jgi:hypothetical protein
MVFIEGDQLSTVYKEKTEAVGISSGQKFRFVQLKSILEREIEKNQKNIQTNKPKNVKLVGMIWKNSQNCEIRELSQKKSFKPRSNRF